MQMIATAKFQKSLKRAVGTKPYTMKVREMVEELADGLGGNVEHPLLRKVGGEERVGRIALVVITSNRGLAGAYNGSVLRAAERFLKAADAAGTKVDLYVNGKKGASFFRFVGRKVERVLGVSDEPRSEETSDFASELIGQLQSRRALFVAALLRDTERRRPDRGVLRAQIVMGRDLAIRTLVLQGSFLVAAGVAARIGTAEVGAHYIALQLWLFLALALDSFAIAAQSLVGESLGAGRLAEARATAWKVARYGTVTGVLVAVLLLLGSDFIPGLFTSDPAVLSGAATIWWWFALMQPVAGLVFALDGVLMGSGDVAFLRTLTIAAGLGGFLPLTLLSIPLGLGLSGIWAGLTALIVIRLIGGCLRVRGGRWAVGGASIH